MYIIKVGCTLVSYYKNIRLNINRTIFWYKKMKKIILKKINSMKGLVGVLSFYIKKPINIESHMHKVTTEIECMYFSVNII